MYREPEYEITQNEAEKIIDILDNYQEDLYHILDDKDFDFFFDFANRIRSEVDYAKDKHK